LRSCHLSQAACRLVPNLAPISDQLDPPRRAALTAPASASSSRPRTSRISPRALNASSMPWGLVDPSGGAGDQWCHPFSRFQARRPSCHGARPAMQGLCRTWWQPSRRLDDAGASRTHGGQSISTRGRGPCVPEHRPALVLRDPHAVDDVGARLFDPSDHSNFRELAAHAIDSLPWADIQPFSEAPRRGGNCAPPRASSASTGPPASPPGTPLRCAQSASDGGQPC
jgi:hypothetical protein